MIIGTTKELKNHEYRVGLTPENCAGYIKHGHTVYVESGAGMGAGFTDENYINAGAKILKTAKEVFDKSDMIVKVKELEECEYDYVHEGQILYTYLHLAANKRFADLLLQKGVSAFAYETITDNNGSLPCLRPMSQIAGRLSIQEGAKYLEKGFGGRGILLGGVPGVERGQIVIIGGGVAGTSAAKAAIGMGAAVTILDANLNKLAYLDDIFGSSVTALFRDDANTLKALKTADLVICTLLIPGGSTPKVITRDILKQMKKGSVIVDISIDQGGCCETSRTTSHDDPIFVEEGIVHYCVGNMPGAVPYTSTVALTNATYRYGITIADKGIEEAIKDRNILNGLNIHKHSCTNKNVADALGYEYKEL